VKKLSNKAPAVVFDYNSSIRAVAIQNFSLI